MDIEPHCPVPQPLDPEPGDPGECVYDLAPIFEYLQVEQFMINPDAISITVDELDGGSSSFYVVEGPKNCTDLDRWYWQDPSLTHVVLCPITCDHVRKEHGGRIYFVFGCNWIPK